MNRNFISSSSKSEKDDKDDKLFIACKNQLEELPKNSSIEQKESDNLPTYILKYAIADATYNSIIDLTSGDNIHVPTEITFMSSESKFITLRF